MLLFLLACSAVDPDPTPQFPDALPVVRSASYPAWYLVERLAPAGTIDHALLIPPGEDPPHWTPPTEVVVEAQGADLLVLNGGGFEPWVATASLMESKTVDSAAGVVLIELETATHSHGTDGEHAHGDTDPHTWGEPAAYALQAAQVAAALSKHVDADAVAANLATLQGELTQLGADQRAAIGPSPRPLASNHPSFNYLFRGAGVTVESFDLDPEAAPNEETATAVTAWAATQTRPVLLWESAPTAAATDALPGMDHVFLDPLEQPSGEGPYDYLAQARANLATLKQLAATEGE
jgi:zinc transport system substrate-binding protein